MKFPRWLLRYFFLWMPALVLLAVLHTGSNLAEPDYARADDSIISSSNSNPPDTKIEQSPFKFTKKTTATFLFSSTKTATFQCSIDSQPYAPCTSPATYKNLSIGPHIFKVKSIDTFGAEDPTPATYSWNIRHKISSRAIELLLEDDYLDML